MKTEIEKLTDRYYNERNPAEKQKLKREIDQLPMTDGELEQVQQREADRKAADIKAFRERKANR